MICLCCGKEVKSLDIHLSRFCSLSPQEYYDQYSGKTSCIDCNNETVFISTSQGYKERCSSCAKIHKSKADSIRLSERNKLNGRGGSPRCVEYWLAKGFDEKTALEEISKLQKKQSDKFREKAKLDDSLYDRNPTRVKYWIDLGYSLEEAKIKVSERQSTFSLEKCITKYGLEEGTKKFNSRQEKWQKTLQGRDDYSEIVRKRITKIGVSKSSQVFFWKLYNSLPKDIRQLVYFAELNHEIGSYDNANKISYLYDFVVKDVYCLEYNGDKWHGNPMLYQPGSNCNPLIKSILTEDIWEKDLKKTNHIISKGYYTDIIWEYDIKLSENEILGILKERIIQLKEIYDGRISKNQNQNQGAFF